MGIDPRIELPDSWVYTNLWHELSRSRSDLIKRLFNNQSKLRLVTMSESDQISLEIECAELERSIDVLEVGINGCKKKAEAA